VTCPANPETAEKVFNAAKMFPLWLDHASLRRDRNDKEKNTHNNILAL
jgi:hypothetical protein